MVKIDIKGALEFHNEKTGDNLTITKLSKILEISKTSIYNIQKEAPESIRNVFKISEVTGYPLEKLIINDKTK